MTLATLGESRPQRVEQPRLRDDRAPVRDKENERVERARIEPNALPVTCQLSSMSIDA